MDDQRYLRTVFKNVGLSAQDRQEICRILRSDDYTSPFPLTGHITYAKAVVLINIIEDCGLVLTSTLPVALSLVDKNLPPVAAPRSLKRACQRRIKSGKDLNEQIDSLYLNNGDSLGPFCDKISIGKQWLEDQHDQNIAPGTVIVNGVVLELYQHVKKYEHLNWENARRWLSRLFPGQTMRSPKTIQNNWKRLQNKNNVQKNAASRQKLMECTYKLPSPDVIPDHDEVEDMNVSELSDDSFEIPAVDVYHANYDSPTKQKLVEMIRTQDDIISSQNEEIEKEQLQFSAIKAEYGELLEKNKDVIKDRNLLSYELQTLQKREDDLHAHIKTLIKEYNPLKVKNQLQYREKKINGLNETVDAYKNELEQERLRLKELQNTADLEKNKKRKEQKRVSYYKCKARPLEALKDDEIKLLLKEGKQLRYEVENLQCQLEECVSDNSVQTFEGGRYVDAIRLVCYDFLSRNVGTHHVAPLIRSVLEKIAGLNIDRLPKATVVKLMALEADILARKQAARELLNCENATLHTDATTKKDRHYYAYEFTTDKGVTYSAGMMETVGSDTVAQIESTKDLLKDMANLIAPEDVDRNRRPTEYQLLFNIKNSMTDRGPTSKGWVSGLEVWRESILKENIMPNFSDLSSESIKKLSAINDFYCGKHFVLGLAERTKIGLMMWEEEVADITGLIGMEDLPQFAKWNCQKPSGLRLVRTACEIIGPGAKEPHGVPTLFNDLINTKNHIPQYQHNRFNIIFKASSAVYHHRSHLENMLTELGSENKLHKAVLADLKHTVSLAEVHAIGLLEAHVTTPLSTLTSKKDHVLDLKNYYMRLKEFLTDMVECSKPLLDGSAVLYQDYPPIKNEVWASLHEPTTEEHAILVEQILSILCASFLVCVERQLFDFVSGKWVEETEELRHETRSVPRNNDVSERDFSGLDRLLRIKGTAKLDFIRGMLLFTHNKTADALKVMSDSDLHKELNFAVTLARESLKQSKKNQADLKQQRLASLEEKKKKREALEQSRIRHAQKAMDSVLIDGQQKSRANVEIMLAKYDSERAKKDAIKRQLDYYKTLKIKSMPPKKFYMTCAGKEHNVETLKENLIFVIEVWSGVFDSGPASSTLNVPPSDLTVSDITGKKERICHLKRKLLDEASDERAKKAKRCNPHASTAPFPDGDIVGKEIKHKYEVTTRTGNKTTKWYKGTVLRRVNEDELVDGASPEDMILVEQGYSIFMVHYEKHEHAEPICLEVDWNNGDIKLT